jgi:hypothetical protein
MMALSSPSSLPNLLVWCMSVECQLHPTLNQAKDHRSFVRRTTSRFDESLQVIWALQSA